MSRRSHNRMKTFIMVEGEWIPAEDVQLNIKTEPLIDSARLLIGREGIHLVYVN